MTSTNTAPTGTNLQIWNKLQRVPFGQLDLHPGALLQGALLP